MCGIIGYLGKNHALPILIDGLRRLEYRGYDSAGVAVNTAQGVLAIKAVGKIKELENKLITLEKTQGNLGIAHTRWATHGAPSEINAHPHCDCHGKIWLVHNGIIENYKEIKNYLIKRGHKFKSETDTEVIVHLIEDLYYGDLTNALINTLKFIKGAYGLVLFHTDEPTKLLAARSGSPLLVGLGKEETIFASDVSAILCHTKQVVYLNDGEIAEVVQGNIKFFNTDRKEIDKTISRIEWDINQAEKRGFPHYMLKEIFEQPETIESSLRGRLVLKQGKVKLGGLENINKKLRHIKKIIIVACGTAKQAASVGKYMLEEYAGIPTEVDYGSEFRYRKTILDEKTAVLAISQSGETADTLAAIREAKEKGALTLGIINSVGSTIARETDAGIYNHIGPEIAVASTKAFTSQITILTLLTILLGRLRQMSFVTGERIIQELQTLPEKAKKTIKQSNQIENIAKKYYKYKNFAYLGRKYNFPIALEGAIKLKEISYIHAEGFASGELKHGPIALIDENFPTLIIAPQDSVFEKNLSNMEEIKARSGKIIALTTENNERIDEIADDIIYIPKTLEMLTPILSVIPLQLFAYHMAVLNNRDVDKPRNLAKSVTVE